ncbi:MAG TPA: hypothetical protein VFZ61_30555 [Polyangiales bacterium]
MGQNVEARGSARQQNQHRLASFSIARVRSARYVRGGLLLALLGTSLTFGCGEAEEPDTGGTPVGPPIGGGSGSPSLVADAGNTPVGSGAPAGPVVPGQTPVVPGAVVDAGASNPTPGGGSADSQWCKVKAILDKNCTACHTTPAAGGAPFPLETYAQLSGAHPGKPGKKVYERVGLRVHADRSQAEQLGVMPPGKQLPAADIALIDSWVAAGAPGSDAPCASTGVDPGTTAEEWPLKECDAVYKIVAHGEGGVDTPAMAAPGRESHPQIAWDAPWGDEQVQAIAFKTITDNKAVLHHWILGGRPGGFLTGWAPGEDGIKKMRDDVGMLMPTGKGALNLDMHYFNTTGTKAEPDKSGVEVCVVKKEHFRKNNSAVATGLVSFLSIPPNTMGYQAKGSCTHSGTGPITLLSASPHAHKLAVRMIFTLQKKNGQTITMHDMPFMFGEQKSYPLEPPVVVDPGDVITTTCVFNNTTNRTVTFGESTNDEMCFNFAAYYPAGGLRCGSGGRGGLLGGN